MPNDVLRCTNCKEEKLEANFYRCNDKYHIKRNGRESWCKKCAKKCHQVRQKKDPEYREKNVERSRLWKLNNPERARNIHRNSTLKKKYGIDLEQFTELLEKQDYKCAICNQRIIGNGGRKDNLACVDHCHKTGLIRGILCKPCNFTLGNAKDSPHILRRAAEYLDEYENV